MKAPPPFPVVAPPKPATGAAPVPHVAVAAELPAGGAPGTGGKIPLFKRKAVLISALAALLLLGAGGFFAWKKFLAPTPAPVVVTPKAGTPAAKSPTAATTPANPPTPMPGEIGPGRPSDPLNTVAQAPANAINKAKGVVGGRDASGQSKVEPILDGTDIANKAAAPAGTKAGPATKSGGGAVTTLGPGLSATNAGDASAEVSPAFRAFVGNVKVSSVIGGPAPKATLNNRVIRIGEVIDGGLGVVLEGVDEGARQLLFKDKTGAVLARRY